jgi:hypothetical protein
MMDIGLGGKIHSHGQEVAFAQELVCLQEGIFRRRKVSNAKLQEFIDYQCAVHEQLFNRNGPLFISEIAEQHEKVQLKLYEMMLPNHAVRHLLNDLKRQVRSELKEQGSKVRDPK